MGTALLPSSGSFLDPHAMLHRHVVVKLFVVIGDLLALAIDQTKFEVLKMLGTKSELSVGFSATRGLASGRGF